MTSSPERFAAQDALFAFGETSGSPGVRQLGFGNWVWDLASGEITWSQNSYRIFGLDPGTVKLSYEAYCRIVHPDDLPAVQIAIDQSLRCCIPFQLEYRIVRRNGQVRILLIGGEPFCEEKGKPLRIAGSVCDITDQRQAEKRLRDSEAALRVIFDGAYDAIFLHNIDGRIIDVNRQMMSLYGVTKEEALRLSIAGDYSSAKNDLSSLPDYWQQAMRGETCVFEWIARRPHDGGEFDVEVVLRKTRLPDSEVIIATVRDITERKRLEEKLLLASRVLENSSEGVVVTDAEGVIEMVNPAFTAITGYTAQEAIGKTPRILKSEHHDTAFYEQMWEKLRTDGQWAGEIWNRRKSGEAYPEWLSISAIHGSQGKIAHFISIFHDITAMKKAQAEIHFQAYHDGLTGLPNRNLFLDRLQVALNHAARHTRNLAVLFLDLDHFKKINDTLGHAAGDELLHEVARRLCEAVREEDTVSRLGGDEFTIILTSAETSAAVAVVARRILQTISRPFRLRGQDVFVGTSIGISLYPQDGTEAETLIKNADNAMYRAKQQGRNGFQFFYGRYGRRCTASGPHV